MKAAMLRELEKPLTIEDVEVSKPGPHEVLIRTAAAGAASSRSTRSPRSSTSRSASARPTA